MVSLRTKHPIFRAIHLMIRRVYPLSAFLVFVLGGQTAQANQCFASGPRYQLEADTVEWRMNIRRNENCLRGVRFSYVYNVTVNVVSSPRSGHVAVVGPGFSYTAEPDFHGEDIFVVSVSGYRYKKKGSSNIRVVVTVGDAQEKMKPAFARFEAY